MGKKSFREFEREGEIERALSKKERRRERVSFRDRQRKRECKLQRYRQRESKPQRNETERME